VLLYTNKQNGSAESQRQNTVWKQAMSTQLYHDNGGTLKVFADSLENHKIAKSLSTQHFKQKHPMHLETGHCLQTTFNAPNQTAQKVQKPANNSATFTGLFKIYWFLSAHD